MSLLLFKPKRMSGLGTYYALTGLVIRYGLEAQKTEARLADGLLEALEASRGWMVGTFRALSALAEASVFEEDRREVCKPGRRPVLVLDMDETLLHSHGDPEAHHDTLVRMRIGGELHLACVNLRPHLALFLETVTQWYDVVVFTSGVREYADPLLDVIDPCGLIRGRLYRDSCTRSAAGYVKDLSRVGADTSRVAIIDNSPISYARHEDNAIPIPAWTDDPNDEELLDLLPLLQQLSALSDVRSLLALRRSGGRVGCAGRAAKRVAAT